MTQTHTQLREELIEKLRPLLFEAGLEPKDLAHKNLGGRIVDVFLTKQSEEQAELVRKIEGLKKEVRSVHESNFNYALDNVLALIKNQ